MKPCVGVPVQLGSAAFGLMVAAALLCLILPGPAQAQSRAAGGSQSTFKTPELAAQALAEACKSYDSRALQQILGADAKELLDSGDAEQDRLSCQAFAKACDEMMKVLRSGPNSMILQVGKSNWPVPIPIVREKQGWRFDTAAGKEEILSRRIGFNELDAMEVCRAFTQAQREYFLKDRDGDGVLEFAQKFASAPGQMDGLCWPQTTGASRSPMGPRAAGAAREEAGASPSGGGAIPYYGYFYRVLAGQGPNAPGGAYGYVIHGNMVAGCALIAYPAAYGSTGVQSFLVGPSGALYEKDLGERTADTVQAIQLFDPDPSWKKVS